MSLTEVLRNLTGAAKARVRSAPQPIEAPAIETSHPLDDQKTREPWHDLLPFTTHRIRLGADRYTAAVGVEPDIDVRTDIVVREAGGDLQGRSVVDLGCNEGGFALEFARRGAASVLGIEYRDISVRRCELARDLMGLEQAKFVCGDLTNGIPADGEYDVVFASGILYHFDQPEKVLAGLRALCSGFMLLDTHVADPERVTHDCSEEVTLPCPTGEPYRGRWFSEFGEDSSGTARDLMLWASSTNARSFWPFEPDLRRMLANAGFSSVTAIDPVEDPERWQVDRTNRVLYVCRP